MSIARLAGTLKPTADLQRERVRVALIAMVRDLAAQIEGRAKAAALTGDRDREIDTYPWFIDDRAGTVRDNAGGLIAYIDPEALHLVQQLQALGVA